MNDLTRLYNSTDGYMFETSLTFHGLFVTDLNKFNDFDNELNLNFANDWRVSIKEVELLVRDSAVRDQQSQLTEAVDAALELARKKYREVKYFVEKTFANSTAHRNEFGLDTYADVRTTVPAMILFLEEMHQACTKYALKLINKGYSQMRIDDIITVKENLREANLLQEMFKKGRPTQTQERIAILNKCYGFTSQVASAAQIVFEGEPSKAQQYVFIRSIEKGKSIDDNDTPTDNNDTTTDNEALLS